MTSRGTGSSGQRTDRGTLDALTRRERAAVRDVLIAAAAPDGRVAGRTRVQDLVRTAPMDAVPPAASLHRLSGSVLRGLDGIAGVPGPVLARLAAVRQRSSFHHLLVTATLERIGEEFDRAGIAWVVMKGPVVAALLYPEPADRSYGDLDLLVGRRDFSVAMGILEKLGFEHRVRNWALAERMLAGQVGMCSPVVDVDLHWHVHYSRQDRQPFGLDPEAMIARRRCVDVSGVDVPSLDPVDTLLTLAFHAARSDGHRLIWLKDIERSLAVEAPDLEALVERAQAQRCAPPVGIVLDRARAVLGAEVPGRVVRDLTSGPLRAAERVTTWLVDPVQFHERDTLTRMFTRSIRSSTRETLSDVPRRGARMLHRQRFPPASNETSDPDEKASYLRAVAAS